MRADPMNFDTRITETCVVPHSLPACLKAVWTQVFFPGNAPETGPWNARHLLWLLILPAILLYPCTGFLLFEPDESRYAQIPAEMLAAGDWVVPRLQGEPYLDKPPLFYWLVAASYEIFGVHDWAARLVPALAVHATMLLTYLLGRRSLGEPAAFHGALLLSLAPGFVSIGRLLVMDGPLTLCVMTALLSLWEATEHGRLRRGWWTAASIACGLGVLTKGPVALVLTLVPWWVFRRITRADAATKRDRLAFAAGVLAVCLPWYVMATVRLPGFARHFLWTHNIVRFLTPFDHQQPVWFFVPILAAGLFPGSVLTLGFTRFLVSSDSRRRSLRCPALGYWLLAGLWCFLFFSLSGSKLPTYVLPAFPPLALAIGYYTAHAWSGSRLARPALIGVTALLLAAHYVAVPSYARFHSPMSRPDEVARYCDDPATPVVCYPRSCDSVAFYLGRSDFKSFRSKETAELLSYVADRPRTVVLFTHRHSPAFLETVLPPHLRLTDLVPVSRSWARTWKTEYCYMGVIERSAQAAP